MKVAVQQLLKTSYGHVSPLAAHASPSFGATLGQTSPPPVPVELALVGLPPPPPLPPAPEPPVPLALALALVLVLAIVLVDALPPLAPVEAELATLALEDEDVSSSG